jgi:hypothetical protein
MAMAFFRICSLLVLVLSLGAIGLAAQVVSEERNASGPALGFTIGQIQRDLNLGLNVTSPTFFDGAMAIRARVALAYYEHVVLERTTWTPYAHASIGLAGFSGFLNESIRCYGEGGFILLLPSAEFSEKSAVPGGYGLFGFEFFLTKHMAYSIEIGGTGTGAVADRVPTDPIYSNGLMISAGVRVVL